jgi:hypothetical protein
LAPDRSKVPFEEYIEELSRYRLGLSLPGGGDICHRDVEILGMGLPLLRPRFRCAFHNPLIPDVHYLAVEADGWWGCRKRLAEAIEARYREVAGDEALLASVARAGARWFDENVRHPACLELTAGLLV